MTKAIEFRICQHSMTLAIAVGPNAEREIMHCAAQHRQVGEVTIEHNAAGHWKRYALLCQWPAAPEDTE